MVFNSHTFAPSQGPEVYIHLPCRHRSPPPGERLTHPVHRLYGSRPNLDFLRAAGGQQFLPLNAIGQICVKSQDSQLS